MDREIYVDIFPNDKEASFTLLEHARNLPEAEMNKALGRLVTGNKVTYYLSVRRAVQVCRSLEITDYQIRPNVQWNKEVGYLRDLLESHKRRY